MVRKSNRAVLPRAHSPRNLPSAHSAGIRARVCSSRSGRALMRRSKPLHVSPEQVDIAGLEMPFEPRHMEIRATKKILGERVLLETVAHAVLDPLAELVLVLHELRKVPTV